MHRNGSDPTGHSDGRNDTPDGTIRRRRPSFAPIPEELLLSAVSDRAVRLYGLLDRQAGPREKAIDSRRHLAQKLRCSPSALARAMRELRDHGWLTVELVPGRVNRYILEDRPATDRTLTTGGDTPNGGLTTGGETPVSPVVTHTRAIPSLRGEEKGEVPAAPPTLEPEPEQRPPTYVGRCPKHAHHPDPPDCHGCKRARIAHEKMLATQAAAAPADVLCPTHRLLHHPGAQCRGCRADQLEAGHSAELNPADATPGRSASASTRSTDRANTGASSSSRLPRSTLPRSGRSPASLATGIATLMSRST